MIVHHKLTFILKTDKSPKSYKHRMHFPILLIEINDHQHEKIK